MQTEYLKTLQVVAQVGSFSNAATELCVTQSAISQRIKFLEEHYGHQLLDRSGPLPVLTDAGKLVVSRGNQILTIEAGLLNDLKQIVGRPRLSICCTPTFGAVFMPQVIRQFVLKNIMDCDLKCMSHSFDQALKAIQQNEFDLAVIEHCNHLDISGFELKKLPDDEMLFVSSPDFGLPDSDLDIQQLLQHTLITRKSCCSSRVLLEANLSKAGYSTENFKRIIIMDDFRLIIDTVFNRAGFAFISKSLVEEYLEKGLLHKHHVHSFIHHRNRTVIVNKRKLGESSLSCFLDCILVLFEKETDLKPVPVPA